jgi:transposase
MTPRKQKPQEELFPFVEMAKLVPDNHLLRAVDRYVDFSFIDELVSHTYSDSLGRPATDPELMVRILVIGYLYGLKENRLFEELRMHAAYRWFCNLGFHEPTPDRSTLNKLRNHRWATDGIVQQIMDNIVGQCAAAGLIRGKHLAVDGTKIRANAAITSLEPIEVEVGVDEYLGRLGLKSAPHADRREDSHPGDKDFRGTTLSNDTHRSATDPDARLYKKAEGEEASLSYVGNTMIDAESRVILAVQVTQPGVATEADAAVVMLDALDRTGLLADVETLAADTGYGSTAFVTTLVDRGVTPHVPLRAAPALEPVPSWRRATHNPEHLRKRNEKVKHAHVRNYVRTLAATAAYKRSQKHRKRIEHLFAEAKVCHGLGRARCRGIRAMQEQLVMTAVVQNIKRLVSFMRKKQKQAAAVNAKTASESLFSSVFRIYMPKIRKIITPNLYSFIKTLTKAVSLRFETGI